MADTPAVSTPIKAGAAGVVAGGLIAIGYQFRHDPQVLFILLLGVVCVGLLLLGYRWVLNRREAAKSAAMGEELKVSGRRKPREINQPNALAQIADLQGKFEEGLEKFRAAGKNLYSLPWYLLIGEPGSGKTEAIRHCNVGFPPGLQEEQQGVGGTVNMNWWFTNHGVILDTAGRLVFGGVEAGASPEWREFLKLLLRARPNCPINGLLLVIPSDSLIVDTADQIDAKAGKIAQQLDTIQRTLGVRFPAFVVVTKADRINGFREFFDSMTDPRLQHQMLGWSNPDPLDAPFNPELVDQHLATVSQRLTRRRLGLLLDPVHTDDPMTGRRLDQVDALYAFPESLTVVAPRLRRYLERIFTVSEWAPKPLFLRGIYFTSSMREGSALDKDLADLLGVPVQQLPEGRVWEHDRAYFLRDLFMNKVFRERGLVTRASNTKRVEAGRKLAVLGTGFAAVLILSAMTVYARRKLDASVGEQADYWTDLRTAYANTNMGLVSAGGDPTVAPAVYRGQEPVPFGADRPQLRQVLADAHAQVDKAVTVPYAFFWTKLAPLYQQSERTEAYRRLFEADVVQPLVDGVRRKLLATATADPGLDATDDAAARTAGAVQSLLQLEAAAGRANPNAPDAPRPAVKLDPLFRYLLTDKQYALYAPDAAMLQESFAWLYPPGPGKEPWAFHFVDVGTEASARPITAGVDDLIDHWNGQFGDEQSRRITVRLYHLLRDAATADRALAQRFTTDDATVPHTASDLAVAGRLWDRSSGQIHDRRAAADGLLARINGHPEKWHDRSSLAAMYRDDRVTAADAAVAQLAAVRAAFPPAPPAMSELGQDLAKLSSAADGLKQANAAVAADARPTADLLAVDATWFRGADAPRYRSIDDAYQAVGEQVSKFQRAGDPAGDGPLDRLTAAAQQVPQAFADAKACAAGLDAALPPDDAPSAAAVDHRKVCRSVLQQLGVVGRIDRLEAAMVSNDLQTESNVAAAVARSASKATTGPAVAEPAPLPMTAAVTDADGQTYPSTTALPLLSAWGVLRPAIGASPGSSTPQYVAQDQAIQAYAAAYVGHWAQVLANVGAAKPVGWAELAKKLPPADEADGVTAVAKAVDAALRPIDVKMIADPGTATALNRALTQAATAANGVPAGQRSAMSAVRDRWATLAGQSPVAARGQLASAGPAGVARDDLVLAPPPGLFGTYWKGVTRTALESLAADDGSMVGDLQQTALAAAHRYPLAAPVDGAAPMTVAELQQLSADLTRLEAVRGTADATAFAGIPDPDGWFQQTYRRIERGTGGAPGGGGGRLDAVRQLVKVLAGPAQICRVETLERDRQAVLGGRGATLAPSTEVVTFTWNGQVLNNPSPAVPAYGSKGIKVYYQLDATGAGTVQFGSAKLSFPGPWACLRILYQTHAQRDATDGRVWLVPLPDVTANGPATVWVRFTFDQPLPALQP